MNRDFRVAVGVFRHPKILRLKKELGAEGVVSLMTLWAHTAENKPDGVLTGMNTTDIEIASGWNGVAGKFVRTLVSLHLLDKLDRGYVVHGWRDHNEYAFHAPARSEKAKKAAAARWGGDATSIDKQCSEHGEAMPVASSGNAPSPSPSPSPSPTPSPSPSPSPTPSPTPTPTPTPATGPSPAPEIKDVPGEHAASAAGASPLHDAFTKPTPGNGKPNTNGKNLWNGQPLAVWESRWGLPSDGTDGERLDRISAEMARLHAEQMVENARFVEECKAEQAGRRGR